MTTAAQPNNDKELVLDRLIDAPRNILFRCWTQPDLIKQWFVPRPWTIAEASVDVRPGGSSLIVMADPDGNLFPNAGIYLDVVPNEKLVFTDAFTSAWEPSDKPFFTCEITFADEGGKTRYIARAKHWTVESREEHEKMGFHEGWGMCADQLEELARTL